MTRRRNTSIGDIFKRPPGDEPWRYPFAEVKHETGEGYYISDESMMLSRAQPGDLVADHVISSRPYWEVKFVDEETGRIWLDPIGDNPYLTGVGAGGARLGDHDWKALSGEAAQEEVDRALGRVSSRCVTAYQQLVPLLKGWVPPFFGPNGAQGGGYGSNWRHTVGAREGLSPEEMVAKDARAIERFGIDVPPAAIRGEISPEVWQEFVRGGYDLKHLTGTELRGEDWSDSDAAIAMILRCPMEPIKVRNWDALAVLMNPAPREIVRRETSPARWDDPAWVEEYNRVCDEIHARSRRGEYMNRRLERRVHDLALEVVDLSHPRCPAEDDVYVRVRLRALATACSVGWLDVIRAYETDPSFAVRHEVAYAWRAKRDEAALRRMESVETHPNTLLSILLALHDLGLDPLDVVDADSARYVSVLIAADEDSWLVAHARALNDQIVSWRRDKTRSSSFLGEDWQSGLERRRRESAQE